MAIIKRGAGEAIDIVKEIQKQTAYGLPELPFVTVDIPKDLWMRIVEFK